MINKPTMQLVKKMKNKITPLPACVPKQMFVIVQVELTNIQKKYYRAILEKNFSFLSKGANQHNMPNLINTMMELRKCCNHPYLITGENTHRRHTSARLFMRKSAPLVKDGLSYTPAE